MRVVLCTAYCLAIFIHKAHFIRNKPGIYRPLAFSSAGYGGLDFPKERTTSSIGNKRTVLLDHSLNLAVVIITPAPGCLIVHGNLVLIVESTGRIQRNRGGCIVDIVVPTVVAQLHLTTVLTSNRLWDFIGPARLIPYQIRVIRGNVPCMPSTIWVGNTKSNSAGYIRSSVTVRSAPIT